jgi:hypothetical protein
MSLHNISIRLVEAGREAEAQRASQDADEIRKRLAAANPAVYEPDLAMSLDNLSVHLGEVGRGA